MGEEKLKPCPFCGGEAEIIRYVNTYHAWSKKIVCKKCGIMLDCIGDGFENRYYNVDEAIAAWNRRVDDAEK